MKALSKKQSCDLIKRELGINPVALTAPDDMNQNPNYPWYTLHSGTQRIEVYTEDFQQGRYTDKMVALSITHENSSKGTTEYFYGDNLEFAEIYTEWRNREAFCESMDDSESDPMLNRLKWDARDDSWNHFHGKSVIKEKAPHKDARSEHQLTSGELNELRSYSSLEKAAWNNFQGKLLQGHDLFMLRVFNLHGEYYSDAGPFDETQLDWWVKRVTHAVDSNPEEAAGFTVFTWNRNLEDWEKYSPDGFTTMTYDTGRRPDGVWGNYKEQLPALPNINSLKDRISQAQQPSKSENVHENVAKSQNRSIE